MRRVAVDSGARAYTQSIAMGPYRLTADESVAVGGADQGPNPHELLLGALGACTGITIRMYAQHKQWPLDGTRIELVHSRATGVDEIDVAISLIGDPIYRTLASGARIRLALTD